MSELARPHTPTPEPSMRRDNFTPTHSPSHTKDTSDTVNAMTPPPSTQLSRSGAKSAQAKSMSRREDSLASPPPTLRAGPPITSVGLFGEVPTIESVKNMDEDHLRTLISELLPALGEARVTAAHSKLQHSLLAIENEESAKRAKVEHEATRREVQVLQEGSPIQQRFGLSPIRSPKATVQQSLHLALTRCRELQHENLLLQRRLRSSKKIIAQLDGRNAELKDHVELLRQRIRENRVHLNDMQLSGAISITGTPVTEYSTPLPKGTPRTPATGMQIRELDSQTVGSQDPFDALLFAGQVLNGEATSVPSTPNQPRSRRNHASHKRGAHSLSSLPLTPIRSRPVTADNAILTLIGRPSTSHHVSFSAPNTQLTYDEESQVRDDRDSTISASDNEDDVDIPNSQASQMATRMLRHSIGSQHSATPAPLPDSSRLTQGKLFGQVKKPGVAGNSLKRGHDVNSYDEIVRRSKKAKITASGTERVGLGIRSWPSAGR